MTTNGKESSARCVGSENPARPRHPVKGRGRSCTPPFIGRYLLTSTLVHTHPIVANFILRTLAAASLATIVTAVLGFAIGNAAGSICETHFLLAASTVGHTGNAVFICVLIARAVSAGRCCHTDALAAVVVLRAVTATPFTPVVPAVLAFAIGQADAKPFHTVLLRPLAGSTVATTAVRPALCNLACRDAFALPLNAAHLGAFALTTRTSATVVPALDGVAIRQAACPIFEACLPLSAGAVVGARVAVFARSLLAKAVAAAAQRLALAFLAGGTFKAIPAATFTAIISTLLRVASHEDAQGFDALLATAATTIVRASGAIFAIQGTALAVPAEHALTALSIYAACIGPAPAVGWTTAAALSQGLLTLPVPTGLLFAPRRAAVAILSISIVALFAFLEDAIPALRTHTRFALSFKTTGGAAVAVIDGIGAVFPFRRLAIPIADEVVDLANCTATVKVGVVAVVAFLALLRLSIPAEGETITARSHCATESRIACTIFRAGGAVLPLLIAF